MVVLGRAHVEVHLGVVVVGAVGEFCHCFGPAATVEGALVGGILYTRDNITLDLGEWRELVGSAIHDTRDFTRTDELLGITRAANLSPSLCTVEEKVDILLHCHCLRSYVG